MMVDGHKPAFSDFSFAVSQIASHAALAIGRPLCDEEELAKFDNG